MRFIKNQLSLWRIVLLICVTAIAIAIATRVGPSAIAVVAKHSKDGKAAVSEGVARHQDDDY